MTDLFEPNVRKCSLKIRISLCVCAVWSGSSLYAFWMAKNTISGHVDNEDSEQTVHMSEGMFSHLAAHLSQKAMLTDSISKKTKKTTKKKQLKQKQKQKTNKKKKKKKKKTEKQRQRKDYTRFYWVLISKYGTGLKKRKKRKTLLLQGLWEAEFYNDIVYKFRKKCRKIRILWSFY